MKLQRIVELFRWLYDSTIDTPVRSTIRYIFSLFTSFVRRHKKWTTIQKESTSEARPTNDFKDHQAGPAFETAPPFHSLESVVSASNIPVPAHETVLSSSSQDVRASSIHSDASAQRFLQVPVINSRPVMQPNSSDGQTPGSSPPSPQGQLSVSRPISSYAKKNGSVSQNSMHSSTAINRELSEEGVETVSIHTSPEVPVDPPFTPGMMQLSEVHERFLPIVPELYPRYERTTYVPAQRNTYILAPQTTSFGP
ncbi:hypothetical protein F5880DRAFT_347546 [Lentinula raphanica]|nr:hypothetical protein F5880DRAFT_347546 [Lentinula raphanica]